MSSHAASRLVLVTLQLLWQNTMIKATYKRKHSIWDHSSRGLICDHLGGEQVGSHGAGAVAERLHLAPQVDRTLGRAWAFETTKLITTPLPHNRATPHNPFHTVPPTEDQAFQYMSLWGPFSSNHHIPHPHDHIPHPHDLILMAEITVSASRQCSDSLLLVQEKQILASCTLLGVRAVSENRSLQIHSLQGMEISSVSAK